jgi:hypothetical protein
MSRPAPATTRENYSTPQKAGERLVRHYHLPAGPVVDAIAAAQSAPGSWIPVAGADGKAAVRFSDGKWKIRIRSKREDG